MTQHTRIITVIALAALAIILGIAAGSAHSSTPPKLRQGEARVFQTAAAFDLEDQGYYNVVKQRVCDRYSTFELKCGLTGNSDFVFVSSTGKRHVIKRDCRWTVTVRKSIRHEGRRTLTSTWSSGARGVCVQPE